MIADKGGLDTVQPDPMPVDGNVTQSLAGPHRDLQAPGAAARELPQATVALLREGLPLPALSTGQAAVSTYMTGVFKNGKLLRAAFMEVGAEFIFSDPAAPGDYYRVEAAFTGPARLPSRLLYGRITAVSNPLYIIEQ